MNIFATSPDPKQSAIWLDDKRVNKMITESAQIICTVLAADGVKDLPFKPTHAHHPIVKWAGDTPANLWWTLQHHHALHGEWTYRFGKLHASGLSFKTAESIHQAKFPKAFQNSAKNESRGLDFTWCDDVHLAYRMYMTARWINDTRIPKWTKRSQPDWRLNCGEEGYFDLCKRAIQKRDNLCPRCGDELVFSGKGRLSSVQCKTSNCILWEPI